MTNDAKEPPTAAPSSGAPAAPLAAPHDAETLAVLATRAKRELRKRLRGLRAALPAGSVAQRSAAVAERVTALPAWREARTVALFVSMPDEVQTLALVEAARSAGKRVALPTVTDDPWLTFRAPYELAESVTPKSYADDPRFEMSAFGVYEPVASAPEVSLETVDLVIVPALAFAPDGHRLGYGRGYYDRTLERSAATMLRVGVAFDFQLLAEVPTQSGDHPVHVIVTDARTLDARAGAENSEDPPPRRRRAR